jgi:hypothetical protein
VPIVSLPTRQRETLAELKAACFDKRWPERPSWVRTRHLATPRRAPFLRMLFDKGLVDRRDPDGGGSGDAAMTREFFWRINDAGLKALRRAERAERAR